MPSLAQSVATVQVVDPFESENELEVTWFETPSSYRQPILILALQGLFDAGKASTNAAVWIREHTDSALIGEFDPEEMYNFAETRPHTGFGPDGQRIIDWPKVKIFGCRAEGPRDALVVVGIEPQYRWRSLAEAVGRLVLLSGTELVITLGSTLAMTPHTRPARVVGSAGDPILAQRMQLNSPSYEGPTGVIGVINQTLEASSLPVLSLRSEVPHYVPGAPSPKATQVLLRRLEQLTGIPTKYTDLDGHVHEWTRQVDEAVQADEESRVYLQHLEKRVDQDEDRFPSGDDLAAELEAYLRESGDSGSD